jgi:hypothetical protein
VGIHFLRRGRKITTRRNTHADSAAPSPRLLSNEGRAPSHESALHGWWLDPGRIVVAAAGSPADLPDRWEAVECMDSTCEPGEMSISTTSTASLRRFIPDASEEQMADQQNAMLGMLKRRGILGPIVWAAYWGDRDLADCERLWVLEGELAELYAYLNAGIASKTGMPELQSSSFGKLAKVKKAASGRDLPFAHSYDYRTVTVRGKTYRLTSQQAQMINILHEAHKNGTPELSIAGILEQLEKKSSRWQDTWKTNKRARIALIQSGERKGALHLKL